MDFCLDIATHDDCYGGCNGLIDMTAYTLLICYFNSVESGVGDANDFLDTVRQFCNDL